MPATKNRISRNNDQQRCSLFQEHYEYKLTKEKINSPAFIFRAITLGDFAPAAVACQRDDPLLALLPREGMNANFKQRLAGAADLLALFILGVAFPPPESLHARGHLAVN